MSVYKELEDENTRQDSIWGKGFDDKHTINEWTVFITSYASRAAMGPPEEIREMLIKAGALCTAAINALDRNQGMPLRHYESL